MDADSSNVLPSYDRTIDHTISPALCYVLDVIVQISRGSRLPSYQNCYVSVTSPCDWCGQHFSGNREASSNSIFCILVSTRFRNRLAIFKDFRRNNEPDCQWRSGTYSWRRYRRFVYSKCFFNKIQNFARSCYRVLELSQVDWSGSNAWRLMVEL